jgi:hypothetical protein
MAGFDLGDVLSIINDATDHRNLQRFTARFAGFNFHDSAIRRLMDYGSDGAPRPRAGTPPQLFISSLKS